MRTVREIVEADEKVAPPSSSSPAPPPLLEIKWVDIISDSSWTPPEEVECPEFVTVGWLAYEDDLVLKIADTLDSEGACWGVTAFPKGVILSVKHIKT